MFICVVCNFSQCCMTTTPPGHTVWCSFKLTPPDKNTCSTVCPEMECFYNLSKIDRGGRKIYLFLLRVCVICTCDLVVLMRYIYIYMYTGVSDKLVKVCTIFLKWLVYIYSTYVSLHVYIV